MEQISRAVVCFEPYGGADLKSFLAECFEQYPRGGFAFVFNGTYTYAVNGMTAKQAQEEHWRKYNREEVMATRNY